MRIARRLFSAVLLAGLLPGIAGAQELNQTGISGFPVPGPEAGASLDAMVAALERSPDLAVAEVGSRTITWGEVADAIRGMPRIVAGIPLKQVYESAAVRVMQQKALALLGVKAGLDKDPAVLRRMKTAEDEVLASEMLRRSIAPNISDAALRKVYDHIVATGMGSDAVRPRVIMVESEDEGIGLIQRLHAGADFGDLARKFSKDGTAPDGGDLGYVRREMLAPELGAVAFALGLGQISAFPIKSGSYWFVMKVEGRSRGTIPSFEDARSALAEDIIHAAIPGLKQSALRDSRMKIYGQPVAAQAGETVR